VLGERGFRKKKGIESISGKRKKELRYEDIVYSANVRVHCGRKR
jgi:hypothetical protein